ncbi:hypothetical protein Poli38472_000195 [Pythium oligandrum]|uniref:FYVE-type domain-containing protein n=1 Tax=Pythium oligandrum TaxID=41045 RepID=A0A8K1CBW1_PYTOL|nr:hypothetical protein Poli38472_000195 [Pythium oligandrum]|eukprot:TMW60153.1 hypothetical protein Poli38472_000195 [Pythium oligandrum]
MSSTTHSASGDCVRFPLEEHVVPLVRIASNRVEDWKTTAQREVEGVLRNPKSWYYRPNELKQTYRSVYEKEAIRGYTRAVPNSSLKDMLCLAHLAMTLEDVVYGLHAVTTNDQRAIFAQLYEDVLLDAAVLRVYEGQTGTDPFHFVGLKWLAFASPAPNMVKPLDHVYFDYSGTTVDAMGRQVLFHYRRSFPLQPEELVHERDLGLLRSSYYQFGLYRIEGGGVLYQCIGCLDIPPEVPTWVHTRALSGEFNSTKNLADLAKSRAIALTGVLRHPVPSAAADNGDHQKMCLECDKKFNVLRTRYICRACGGAICKHCITGLTFFNEESQFMAAPITLSAKFCSFCVKRAREQPAIEHLVTKMGKTSLSEPSRRRHGSHLKTGSTTPKISAENAQIRALRESIEREVGRSPSQSSSPLEDTPAGVARPASLASSVDSDSPMGSFKTKPTPQSKEVFQQMNQAIRQQEELLMTIQKERAKLQARHNSAPGYYSPSAYASAAALPQEYLSPLPQRGAVLLETSSSPSRIPDDERFEELS